jgi:hypothetical protein
MSSTPYGYQILMKSQIFKTDCNSIQTSDLMKIQLVEAELFHVGGRAGRETWGG